MKKKAPEVREQPKKVYWRSMQITQNCVRVFNANKIRFQNQGDQANVIINDTQQLNWSLTGNGDVIQFDSHINEIDCTPYKIRFDFTNAVNTPILVVWVKEDTMQQEPILPVIKPKDRRQIAYDRDKLKSKKRR